MAYGLDGICKNEDVDDDVPGRDKLSQKWSSRSEPLQR